MPMCYNEVCVDYFSNPKGVIIEIAFCVAAVLGIMNGLKVISQ